MSGEGSFPIPPIDSFDDEPSTSNFCKFRRTEFDSTSFTPCQSVEEAAHRDNASNSAKTACTVADTPTCATPTLATPSIETVGTVPKCDRTAGISNVGVGARTVTVSGRQKGNPLLKFLRNVPWEWGDTSADYQISQSCCVLFLSVKFHKLNPEYVHQRFKKIGKTFHSQLMLLLVDVEEADNVLRELNSMCFLTNCWTLILCWSYEECAEYIEALKIYENKPMEFLMTNENRGKQEADDRTILIDLLTSIRSVTKSDAENLIDAFGSLRNITRATVDQLALCRGVGLLKARRIFDAFDQPFICNKNEPTKSLSIDQVNSEKIDFVDNNAIDMLDVEIDDF